MGQSMHATGSELLLCPRVAFGFLGGREVKEAKVGNLGMHDRTTFRCSPHRATGLKLSLVPAEREALRWIQKYISAFGGDPRKVMM